MIKTVVIKTLELLTRSLRYNITLIGNFKFKLIHSNPDGAEKFKTINNAYQVLSDPEKRKMYDMHGEEAINDSGFNYTNPEDIFAQMFNQGFGGFQGFEGGFQGFGQQQSKRPQQPAPIVHKVTLNLQDFYLGTTKTFEIKRTELCNTCDGFGTKSKQHPDTCSNCKGKGYTIERKQFGPGMITQNQRECFACRGTGEMIREDQKCKECRGTKTQKGVHALTMKIQKGQNEGDLVYREEGDQAPNAPKGDVVFQIICAPHPIFTRKGDDLLMKHKISLRDALTGFSLDFQHLDGRICSLTIENEVIKPNQLKKIRGKGMPRLGKDGIYGDLYIQFDVVFPTHEAVSSFKEEIKNQLPNTPVQTLFNTSAKEKVVSSDASLDESKKILEEKKREEKQSNSQRKKRPQEEEVNGCQTQ